jgi:hypothetical protein
MASDYLSAERAQTLNIFAAMRRIPFYEIIIVWLSSTSMIEVQVEPRAFRRS